MKTAINFVCLGNICRSPTAEGVFKSLIERKDLADKFLVDSSGTSGFHIGEKADPRMREHAQKRGYNLTSLSRKFVQEDFNRFDMIIGMDEENIRNIKKLARNSEDEKKVYLMTDFSVKLQTSFVPDPYYGGEQGFEVVLDILEDACEGLLNSLSTK